MTGISYGGRDSEGNADWHALDNVHIIKNETSLTLQVRRLFHLYNLHSMSSHVNSPINELDILWGKIFSHIGFKIKYGGSFLGACFPCVHLTSHNTLLFKLQGLTCIMLLVC